MTKKRSFLKVLRFKKKIRYLTVASTILLSVIMVQLIINNPHKSQAVSWDEDNKIFILRSGTQGFFSNSLFKCFNPSYCNNHWEIDLNGADVIIDGDIDGDGYIESGEGFSVTIEGENELKSLTIRNKAVLIHSELLPTDVVDGTNATNGLDSLDPYARRKKIDIKVSEDITIQSWSRIDASEKGYPGGRIEPCRDNQNYTIFEDGYGPGRGLKDQRLGDRGGDAKAGGGGFGGLGEEGRTSSNGQAYDFVSPSALLEYGSGGGAAYRYWHDGGIGGSGPNRGCNHGGNGGGIIRLIIGGSLNIDNTGKILADGQDNYQYGNQDHPASAIGGGGSGGSIWIEAGSFDIGTNNTYIQASPGDLADENGSGFLNLYPTARGALSNGGNGSGGGGGGRIVIIRRDVPYGLNKILTPIDRNGTGNNFNPYLLQKNDRIEITLNLSRLKIAQINTIEDEIIRNTAENIACLPESAADRGGGAISADGKKISWNMTPLSSNYTLKYYCRVQ